jgi:hypothetical protein
MVRVEATLEAARGGGTVVELPAASLAALGGGARFRVRGTINGATLESSTMGIGGGRVCVGVHKATLQAIGAGPGDPVSLEIERDERVREVVVPAELQAALSEDAEAAATYEGLAFTHRREYAEWIAGAKRPETRKRRVSKAIEMLRARTKHP